MGNRKYPPLTPKQIEKILLKRGFVRFKKKSGDHRYYKCIVNGSKRMAQIDMGAPLIQGYFLKLTITESGMTRKQFYCSTKETAKMIGKKKANKESLANWAEKTA